MKYLTLLFLLVPSHTFAEEKLCENTRSEYRHSLSEIDFSEENFQLALSSLNKASENRANGYDFYDIESDLMYIKGCMFKLHISNNPKNTDMVKLFCEFMSNEAYARHE